MSPATRFPARAAGPAERVAGFMAHLRLNGLGVGLGETGAALAALAAVNPADPREACAALRALLAGTREEAARFDDLFAAYWLNAGRARAGQAADPRRGQRAAPRLPYVAAAMAGAGGVPDGADDGDDEAGQDGAGRLVAARAGNLARADLRRLIEPADIAAAEALAERLARAIRDRRSRRARAASRGRVDLRRMMRASLATGGEPLRLLHRRPPERPAHLVALCDVSGSMKAHARVFLAFLRGLVATDLRADAYLFHTRLVRVADALRDRDRGRALDRLSLMAQGFGGGTRIGGALAAFNAGYARGRVTGRSVVIVLSDGYDTDPPELLAAELARLRRRGCRIVWLNPLKGWRGYAPVARAMAAALPHLDLFAAAGTLADLAALEGELARL